MGLIRAVSAETAEPVLRGFAEYKGYDLNEPVTLVPWIHADNDELNNMYRNDRPRFWCLLLDNDPVMAAVKVLVVDGVRTRACVVLCNTLRTRWLVRVGQSSVCLWEGRHQGPVCTLGGAHDLPWRDGKFCALRQPLPALQPLPVDGDYHQTALEPPFLGWSHTV